MMTEVEHLKALLDETAEIIEKALDSGAILDSWAWGFEDTLREIRKELNND